MGGREYLATSITSLSRTTSTLRPTNSSGRITYALYVMRTKLGVTSTVSHESDNMKLLYPYCGEKYQLSSSGEEMHLGFKVATAGGREGISFMAFSAFSSVGRAGKENVIKTQALPQYFLLFLSSRTLSTTPILPVPRPKEHWQQHEEISKATKASSLLRHPSRPWPDMCG